MRCLFLILILSSFVLHSPAGAQVQCINDKSGKKGAANLDINRSMDQARDPLTLAFLNSQKKNSPAGVCDTAKPPSGSVASLTNGFQNILNHEIKTKKIKKECIEASLQREPGNQGYSCNGKEKKKFENVGKSTPCLNQKTVDFIHFALNQAINCLSTNRSPIDPRFILKKINNETAFNFYLAYSGGKGMGQLTSDPVNEIAGWHQGKKFIPGNAFGILEELMASSNPSCTPFKEIVKNDLNTPPPSPGSPKNYCDWVRPGDGVGRNLVYSLGYYIYMRDNIIRPALERRSPLLAKNNDVINYLTLVAYGPGGPEEAKSLMRKLRLGSGTTPGEAKSGIIRSNTYVNQTEEKMSELLKELKPTSTDADLRGDSCVQ